MPRLPPRSPRPPRPAKPPREPAPPRRPLTVQVSREFYDALVAKVGDYGLSPVVRALLAAYVKGEITLSEEQVQREVKRPPNK